MKENRGSGAEGERADVRGMGLTGQLDRWGRKAEGGARRALGFCSNKEAYAIPLTEREQVEVVPGTRQGTQQVLSRCLLTQSRLFILLASFSPTFVTCHLPTSHTHTLPPPTLPHPAHHCLVNLFKTPICLSDLSGSFKWLRISPGTTQSPSARPP